MPIESEAEWLACDNHMALYLQSSSDVDASPRFRWLAVRWVERIRQFTNNESVLERTDALIRLVREGIPLPERRSPNQPDRDGGRLCPVHPCLLPMEHGAWARAAAFAAGVLADQFGKESPADPRKKLKAGRERKPTVGMQELLAYKSQFAKWAKARQTHIASIGKRFCDEFRDVAGNPFRPIAFDPAWRTEAVVGLAAGIDEAGAYERLPILADALEEAGCTDAQVLSHAREPGVHVRGCWLIDMALERW